MLLVATIGTVMILAGLAIFMSALLLGARLGARTDVCGIDVLGKRADWGGRWLGAQLAKLSRDRGLRRFSLDNADW